MVGTHNTTHQAKPLWDSVPMVDSRPHFETGCSCTNTGSTSPVTVAPRLSCCSPTQQILLSPQNQTCCKNSSHSPSYTASRLIHVDSHSQSLQRLQTKSCRSNALVAFCTVQGTTVRHCPAFSVPCCCTTLILDTPWMQNANVVFAVPCTGHKLSKVMCLKVNQ
jgi:hypothetical protein